MHPYFFGRRLFRPEKELFPQVKLRPKHNFLCHYLIIQFGPLILVCTLRVESKHTFFKRCAKRMQNVINVTKMVAENHQLLQAYYTSWSLFSTDVIIDNLFAITCGPVE